MDLNRDEYTTYEYTTYSVTEPRVIIGAMIVAPLMNPILSMSFGIVTANWKLYKRSIATVFLGAFSVILVSYLPGQTHLIFERQTG